MKSQIHLFFVVGCLALQSGTVTAGEPNKIVIRRQGDDGCRSFRIPGLATTTKGTLIASFDVRWNGAQDLPADIDVGVMRSTDGGLTWNKMVIAVDYDKNAPGSLGNGVGDAAILVDSRDGTVYLAALWSQGNNGWHGSGAGLNEQQTGQLVIASSSDDGVTWDAPVSITPQIKQADWRLCFQGPGAGSQLNDGTLVFAAQYKDVQGKPSSCFIHSKDGRNWRISPPAIPGKPPTSEAQIVQTSERQLLMTMRNESRGPERLWAYWTWKDDLSNGQWEAHWSTVSDPVCMASLIVHPSGVLLLSNCHSNKRERLTIHLSEDAGRTWKYQRLLDARPTAYSCMSALPDGQVGILYEVGDKHSTETLTYSQFSLDWVKQLDQTERSR